MQSKKYTTTCFGTDKSTQTELSFETILYDNNEIELLVDITEISSRETKSLAGMVSSLQEIKRLRNLLNGAIEKFYANRKKET